ncbi:chemotaxis protein [Halobiforma lacisalsi AJ5]|uniref:Chemotaxis protein n=1 Tax=Natronobacterium lacisalsi AJ5 TaxID=358396 RepID=M0LYB0_NATLA|nr:methyl-accepting chemotaxis protein [Halobiforma lacisalsi]APW97535.1 chemotaxis protein [Halobiforma lacisalsi AJ5]EMA37085.1 methyl-accepting chemotaxis sensory transducer [Halobiforma lacisalsi AJ5]
MGGPSGSLLAALRRLVPSAVRQRYALKFGIVLLVLGLSIGGIGFVATGAITDSVAESALEEQRDAAVREASSFDDWNERNENFVVASAGAPVVESGSEEEIGEYLGDVYYDLPDERMHALYVDAETGEILAGADYDAETLSDLEFPNADALADDLSEHEVRRTEPYAMPDALGLSAEEHPVVSYYVGVGGEDGADRALVYTFALSERLVDYTGGDTVVTILDDEGRIVADDRQLGYGEDEANASFGREYADHERFLELARSDGPGATTVEERPSGALAEPPYEFVPDGYVVGYHTTDEGWAVLVHTSEADAFGFVHTVNRFGYLLTAVGVALIGVFGVAVGRTTATSIRALSSRATAIRDGEYDVDLETGRTDEIGDLYRAIDDMRDSLVAQLEESERARERAEEARDRADEAREEAETATKRAREARREAQERTERLERTAADYCEVMGACADGDLTRRLEPDPESEPMAEIATTFNAMVADLERTVATIATFAGEVAETGDDVRGECVALEETGDEVTDSIREIATVAERQNDRMAAMSTEIQETSATVEEIASTANSVAETSRQAARRAEDGMDAAEDVVDEMAAIEARSEAALEEIRDLEEAVDRIDEIVGTVTEIADQTSILALNASIEAAHAGDGSGNADGSGFATVAEEVKGLAAETKTAAGEIEELIGTVQRRTDATVGEMEAMRERVADGSETIDRSVAAFREIETDVRRADDGVQDIDEATDAIADSAAELVSMADEVTDLSDTTASEAEAILESATEQTEATASVSESVTALHRRADRLEELLAEFTTDAAGLEEADAALEDDDDGRQPPALESE